MPRANVRRKNSCTCSSLLPCYASALLSALTQVTKKRCDYCMALDPAAKVRCPKARL